jgi:hypothetical protein
MSIPRTPRHAQRLGLLHRLASVRIHGLPQPNASQCLEYRVNNDNRRDPHVEAPPELVAHIEIGERHQTTEDHAGYHRARRQVLLLVAKIDSFKLLVAPLLDGFTILLLIVGHRHRSMDVQVRPRDGRLGRNTRLRSHG